MLSSGEVESISSSLSNMRLGISLDVALELVDDLRDAIKEASACFNFSELRTLSINLEIMNNLIAKEIRLNG